jgi:DNA (cytosine-5)-methyltransferase 1
VLDIIWLYEPYDTTFGSAYYPFPNELFLSDNCECGTSAIDVECVVGKVDVTWSPPDPEKMFGLLVRQIYHTNVQD